MSLSVDDETGIAGQVKPYDAVRVVSIEGASSGIVDSQTLANPGARCCCWGRRI